MDNRRVFKECIYRLVNFLDTVLHPIRKRARYYYSPNAIHVRNIKPAGEGKISIVFVLAPDTQHYCPGADISISGNKVTLYFVRSHFSSKRPVMIKAERITNDGYGQAIILDVPANPILEVSNKFTSRKIKAGEVPSPEDVTLPLETGPTATCGNYILCINSVLSVSFDDAGIIDGHAWLSLHDCATGSLIHTYGLWPDSHEEIIDAGLANGSVSDVRIDFWKDLLYMSLARCVYCVCINDAQRSKLDTIVSQHHGWRYTNNCSSFASEVFYDVTGIDVDADDVLGIETPREICESIHGLGAGGMALCVISSPAGGSSGSTSKP